MCLPPCLLAWGKVSDRADEGAFSATAVPTHYTLSLNGVPS